MENDVNVKLRKEYDRLLKRVGVGVGEFGLGELGLRLGKLYTNGIEWFDVLLFYVYP